MSSFDNNSFDQSAFDAGAFDFTVDPNALSGTTSATPVDVKVSWVAFDSAVQVVPPEVPMVEGGVILKSTAWDSALTLEQLLHRERLFEEDRFATEFILTLVTSGFVNA